MLFPESDDQKMVFPRFFMNATGLLSPRFSSSGRSASIRGFSLAELLTVIAIVGMLSVASLPALSSLTPASRLSSASEKVMSLLDLAHMDAINANTSVQLRIITTNPANRSSEYRTFSLWRFSKESNSYVQVSKWDTLPEGITFESINDPSLLYPLSDSRYTGSHLFNTQLDNFVSSVYQGKPVETVYIECHPDGSLHLPSLTDTNVYLLLRTSNSNTNGTAPLNWRQVRINAGTGKLRLNAPPA